MPLGRKVAFKHFSALTLFSARGNVNSKFANVPTCHTLASLRSASLCPTWELTNTKFPRYSWYFWEMFRSNMDQQKSFGRPFFVLWAEYPGSDRILIIICTATQVCFGRCNCKRGLPTSPIIFSWAISYMLLAHTPHPVIKC